MPAKARQCQEPPLARRLRQVLPRGGGQGCCRSRSAGSGAAAGVESGTAAAIGAGDELEHVAVGVLEVDAAAAVVVVDHAGLTPAWVGPERQVLRADPAEGGVELFLLHQEGVVLGRYLAAGLGKVQGYAVVGLDDEEVPEAGGRGQAEDAGQERRRPRLVTARDDGVVQLHAHTRDPAQFPRASRKGFQSAGGWRTQNSLPSGS